MKGDPFDPNLHIDDLAAILEGRKLSTSSLNFGKCGRVMYKVMLVRRIVDRGAAQPPLLQFYGPRAVRRWEVGEKEPKDWSEVDNRNELRTVDFGPKEITIK